MQEILAPDKIQGYRDWLALPVSQRVRAIASRASRPSILAGGKVDGTDAAYWLGVFTGFDLLRRMVFDAEELVEDAEMQERLKQLIPSYGAETLIKEGKA